MQYKKQPILVIYAVFTIKCWKKLDKFLRVKQYSKQTNILENSDPLNHLTASFHVCILTGPYSSDHVN